MDLRKSIVSLYRKIAGGSTKHMAQVVIYTTTQRPFCRRTDVLLAQKGVSDLQKIGVDANPEQLVQRIERSGRRSVPQIFIDDVHVGGFDDLIALDHDKKTGLIII